MGHWTALVVGLVAGSALTATATYLMLSSSLSSKKKRVETASTAGAVRTEQMGLLTELLKQLWAYIKVAGADSIRDTVEPMFSEMMPGPLAKLKFTKIDLGTVPIRMDNVIVHKVNEKENSLQFDLDLVWDGNCDIQLKAGVIAFGVKSVKLVGRMCILMRPLTTDLSIVSAIQYSFINPPDLELDFTGLAQVADFAVVDKQIRKMLQDILASMIVLPERIRKRSLLVAMCEVIFQLRGLTLFSRVISVYKMEPSCSFKEIYRKPLGVAMVTVLQGRGFVVEKRTLRKDDIPDCYCNVTLGGRAVRTRTIDDNLSPVWNESCEFLLCDMDQVISVEVMDEDGGPMDPDDFLGETTTTVGEVLLNGGSMEFPLIDKDNKPNDAFITLGCSLFHLTADLGSLKQTKEPNCLAGLLVILVMGAYSIPLTKEAAKTFVQLTYGTKTFVTGVVETAPGVDALNPVYDLAFHCPLEPDMVKDGKLQDIKFELINGVDENLGTMVVTHDQVTKTPESILKETRPIGKGGAKLDFQVALYGVDRSQSTAVVPGSDGAVASKAFTGSMIGASNTRVRVTAVSARGLKVQKRRLRRDDVPDCYCLVKVGTTGKGWRTKTVRNSVYPVWNESKGRCQLFARLWHKNVPASNLTMLIFLASTDFSFTGHKQVIHVDLWDENGGRRTKDDFLGNVRFTVGECLLQAGNATAVEVFMEGKPTGIYVTFKCELVD